MNEEPLHPGYKKGQNLFIIRHTLLNCLLRFPCHVFYNCRLYHATLGFARVGLFIFLTYSDCIFIDHTYGLVTNLPILLLRLNEMITLGQFTRSSFDYETMQSC